MSEQHILVIGAAGQLGKCLTDKLRAQKIPHTLLDRQQADINDTVVLEKIIIEATEQNKVTALINAAAYTNVDKAETEPMLAQRVNVDGPTALAKLCSRFDIPLIHVSTDYVFNGEGKSPYTETDTPSPIGIYGKTKLDGEIAVQRHCQKYIILRTAWVFSEYGNNFVKTMLRLASEHSSLNIVSDQFGCPTYAGDIAASIITILKKLHSGSSDNTGYGLYHYAGNKSVSWYEFALTIFAEAQQRGLIESAPHINAITTSDYPTAAKRPANSALNTTKIFDQFQIPPCNWQQALDVVLKKLN